MKELYALKATTTSVIKGARRTKAQTALEPRRGPEGARRAPDECKTQNITKYVKIHRKTMYKCVSHYQLVINDI